MARVGTDRFRHAKSSRRQKFFRLEDKDADGRKRLLVRVGKRWYIDKEQIGGNGDEVAPDIF